MKRYAQGMLLGLPAPNKIPGRVGYLFHKSVPVARKTGLGDTDEGRAILLGFEYPFDGCRTGVSGHSMTMRLFGSIAFAVTRIEMSYVSQSH